MDNFLLDGVAWHIHREKRIGARGFVALGEMVDVLYRRHQTHPGPVVHHLNRVLPLIYDVLRLPVTERRYGFHSILHLQCYRVQRKLVQDLLHAAQLNCKTRPQAS
jgi:hypothetical protein